MCGIVAYKGPELDAGKIVYDGLKLLEYRGYDSSGIAVIKDKKVKIFNIEKNYWKMGFSKL